MTAPTVTEAPVRRQRRSKQPASRLGPGAVEFYLGAAVRMADANVQREFAAACARLPEGTPVEVTETQGLGKHKRVTSLKRGTVKNVFLADSGDIAVNCHEYKGYPFTCRAADVQTAAELGYTLQGDGEWVRTEQAPEPATA